MPATRKFTTRLEKDGKGRVYVPLPFDPDEVWGTKTTHRLHGQLNGMRYRGETTSIDGGTALVIGAAWRRDCGLAAGDQVKVELDPEGPQLGDLDADIVAALDASPKARDFFESLAQFYRKAYLKWIDGTKRRPDERARRIAEMITLLEAGTKERPK